MLGVDFNEREWMGATIIAGHAIEALLLWAVKKKVETRHSKNRRM